MQRVTSSVNLRQIVLGLLLKTAQHRHRLIILPPLHQVLGISMVRTLRAILLTLVCHGISVVENSHGLPNFYYPFQSTGKISYFPAKYHEWRTTGMIEHDSATLTKPDRVCQWLSSNSATYAPEQTLTATSYTSPYGFDEYLCYARTDGFAYNSTLIPTSYCKSTATSFYISFYHVNHTDKIYFNLAAHSH